MPLTGTYEPSTSNWARKQAETYEASGGTKGTTLQGKPVVLVTSVGAKSGNLRKHPVMRVEHDGEYAVVASNGGAASNPTWFNNLVVNPHVELQDKTERHDYDARRLEGEERAIWWERALEVWPAYGDYQAKTDREIPVFLLTRRLD